MNMKHIIPLLAATVLMTAACTHDLDMNMVSDVIGFATTTNITEPSLLRDGINISVLKSGKGQATSEKASVEIAAFTQSELDEYNEANGTDFLLAPSGKYTLERTELDFAVEDSRQTLHVDWDKNYFFNTNDGGAHYVIALKISESSIKLDSLRSFLLIRPVLSKVGFQNRDIRNFYPDEKMSEEVSEYEGTAKIDNPITTSDVTVNLLIDNSLIPAISEERKVDYKQAPDGLFTLSEDKVVIKAGESFGYFKFSVDYRVLFDSEGEFKEKGVKYIVPLRMADTEPVLIGKDSLSVGYVIVNISDDSTVEPPVGQEISIIHGPWNILEGKDTHIGNDPACPQPGWYSNYNTSKLVDWNFTNSTTDATVNGYWGSWYWTEPEFPMVFVFELDQEYIFGGFNKVDASGVQGQFQDFEVYTAREYAGEDTKWVLAAKGNTGHRGWQSFGDGTNVEDILNRFSYPIPGEEDEAGVFNYTRGKYIKFVIVKKSGAYPDIKGGYLSEFYARGWTM